MTALLAVACAAAAAVATRLALARIAPAAPILRPNYRGVPVSSGLGVTVLAGMLAGMALVAILHGVFPRSRGLFEDALYALIGLAAAAGFALLGLFDDVAGRGGAERGFRAHIDAIGSGRLTSGALKLIGGTALGLAVAAPSATGFGYAIAGGAVVALSANLFNALDVRPGRSAKTFLLAAIPLAVAGGPARPFLTASIGAVAAFLPADLRERAMLGDAGSNAIGAVVGTGLVTVVARPVELVTLVALLGLTLVAEGPTLSRAIDAIPPLRALDRLGRVEEPRRVP